MSGRIVVGVDGSEGSVAALRWALDEATLRGAALEAVTAWTFPYVDAGLAAAPVSFQPADLAEDARSTLEQALALACPDEERRAGITRTVAEERPAAALLSAAESADLLVVGSRGHGGFVGLLLGSVSTQVAHHSRVPVVIVHPESA